MRLRFQCNNLYFLQSNFQYVHTISYTCTKRLTHWTTLSSGSKIWAYQKKLFTGVTFCTYMENDTRLQPNSTVMLTLLHQVWATLRGLDPVHPSWQEAVVVSYVCWQEGILMHYKMENVRVYIQKHIGSFLLVNINLMKSSWNGSQHVPILFQKPNKLWPCYSSGNVSEFNVSWD